MHRDQYNFYRRRAQGQPVAECKVLCLDGKPALALTPHAAPLFTPNDWGGKRMNQRGRRISDSVAMKLARRIAAGAA
jgi:hypothetical protein